MKKKYNVTVVIAMKNLLNLKLKLARAKNKKIFLLRYRKENIAPRNRYIKNVHNIDPNIYHKHLNIFIFSVMNVEISEVIKLIKNITNNISTTNLYLKENVSQIIYNDFINRTECKYEKIFIETKNNHRKKFDSMKNPFVDNNQETNSPTESKWIKNLTMQSKSHITYKKF